MQPSAELGTVDPAMLERRVLSETLAMMCRYSQTSLLLGIPTGLFFVWLISANHSRAAVAGWFAALLFISGVRALLQHRYLRVRATVDPKPWSIAIKIAVAINGFVWAIPSTFMVPVQPSLQVVLGVVSVGLSATALVSLTPLRHAYAYFLIPYLLPIGASYLMIGGDYASMSIGVFAYLLAMLAVAHRNTQGTEELLYLQLDHEALAERLKVENAIVERANRDLEAQVVRRERTEAELRVAKSQAEGANRAKNQFLANMSHELRTPLNGVLGMSELLVRTLSTASGGSKALKYAQTIRSSGERLLHLIDEILDMSRIEAGAMRFENRPFNPRQLSADTVESLTEEASRRNLKLNVTIDPEVPAEALGDELRLRQVLINLIANAIKFTDAGKVDVRLSIGPSAHEDPVRRVSAFRWSVSDTGIGIPERSRDKLFQPFSQLDESSTRRFGGTGLGLAICRQIVNALGGRIDVESHVGKGSTFWFEVPLEIAVQEHVEATPVTSIAASQLQGRVLVAEDNDTNSDLIVEMLALAGCEAVTVTNGLAALDRIEREHFDAVLMDWHMPELDGIAATRALRDWERSQPDKRHLPVIALTASVLAGDREACVQAGMDDFIAKPFGFDQLLRVLSKWLPPKAAVSSF